MLVRRIARPLLSSIFVVMGIDAVRDPAGRAAAATHAVEQYGFLLPGPARAAIESDPENAVRANGLVHAGGGLLLATGKFPRTAAGALTASLVPTTLAGHAFWDETDPAQRKAQMVHFLKNLGLAGGLLLATVDTEGAPALGRTGRKAARRARIGVELALRDTDASPEEITQLADALGYTAQVTKDGRRRRGSAAAKATPDSKAGKKSRKESDRVRVRVESVAADAARDAASRADDITAATRAHGEQLAERARKRGSGLAETARAQGAEWAHTAGHRGTEWAETAGNRGAEWADVAGRRGAELADVAGRRGVELAEAAGRHGVEWAETAGQRGTRLLEVLQAEAPEIRRRARELQSEAPEFGRRALARAEDAVGHAAEAATQAAGGARPRSWGKKSRKGRRKR